MSRDGSASIFPSPFSVAGFTISKATRAFNEIFRGVIAVIVNSINTVTSGSRPHIANECGEIIPPRADFNSTATVIMVSSSGWGEATPSHRLPHAVILWCRFKWHNLKPNGKCPATQGGWYNF